MLALLDKGAEIHARMNEGFTPLIVASMLGNREVVQVLLDRGAEVDAGKDDGATALMLAAQDGHKEVVDAAARQRSASQCHGRQGRFRPDACLPKRPPRGREELLDRGAQINAKDKDGATPLQHASMYGHKVVVRLLLAKKADVNARDNNGETALMLASKDGYREVVQMLLAKKALVNAKDNNGRTALMLASQGGHRDVGKLLQRAGAK